MTSDFQHKVVDLVCDVMQVDKGRLFVPDRRRKIILAKHISMYIFKHRFGLTFREIGEFFTSDGRFLDHTTVLHACRTIQNGLDVRQEEIVTPLEQVTKKLDNLLSRRMKRPNTLVIRYSPLFDINKVMRLLQRNFKNLEMEKK
jgi:hypothetical protein